MKTALDLKVGEIGLIKSYRDMNCACKMLTMGLLPKAKIKLVRKSPFGKCLYLKINTQLVAVRKSEAETIQLEDL